MATGVRYAPDLYKFYEIIGGQKFRIPSMTIAQDQMKGQLMLSIFNHLQETKRGYLFSNVDVHFDDENILVPDLCVVLKERENIFANREYIDGAPDMVIEILSKFTKKKDVTVKKDMYEAGGVREYWIVDPWIQSVSVYLLRDGKYFLDDEYIFFDEDDLDFLIDAERATVKHEVSVKILDGLTIPLEHIFKWAY